MCGRDLWELCTIYVSQAGSYASLTLNAPTLVALFGNISEYHRARVSGMLIVLAVTVTALLVYACARQAKLTKKYYVDFGFLFTLLVPFLLPHMHERYFYLATVFSVIYAFIRPRHAYAAIISEFCSMYVTCRYLFSIDYFSLAFVALLEVVNIALLMRSLYKEYALHGEAQTSPDAEREG